MTSIFLANTNPKIRKFTGKSCSLQPKSGLYVIKKVIQNSLKEELDFHLVLLENLLQFQSEYLKKISWSKMPLRNGIQLYYGAKKIIKIQNYLVRKKKNN